MVNLVNNHFLWKVGLKYFRVNKFFRKQNNNLKNNLRHDNSVFKAQQ